MKKKKNTSTTRRSSASASTPLALRFRFERIRLDKGMEHARQMRAMHTRSKSDAGGHHHPPPHECPNSPVAMRSMLDLAIDAYIRWKWCSDVVKVLDGGIKFLQDYGDQMTEQEKEDYRKDLASLLEAYGDIC